MKKSLATPAVMSALALSLAGCASAPSSSSSSATSTSTSTSTSSATGSAASGDFKACMVSDTGGFDDKSFNATSHAGLEKAVSELGIQQGQVQSTVASDYSKNIASMVQAKCNVIITVGFYLADATVAAAKANPSVDFAIVDANPDGAKGLKNLKPLVFNTAESSFMAGYLAASMTQSGKVGTFGGGKIPTVTIFMDGFAQGVQYYNTQKGKKVQLLGWDAAKQDGQFTQNGFQDIAGGKSTATNLISQGADILFPVAGPAGQGALQAAQSSGGKANVVWVDTDGYVSAPQYKSVIVSSVEKGMDVAVYDAIKAAKDGTFSSDPYVGTLANNGTGLAPFHDFDAKVPADVKKDLDAIKADIVSGKIKISSAAQPK